MHKIECVNPASCLELIYVRQERDALKVELAELSSMAEETATQQQEENAALTVERDALKGELDAANTHVAILQREIGLRHEIEDALQEENERLRIELQCVVERMAIIEAHENEELQALQAENEQLRRLLELAESEGEIMQSYEAAMEAIEEMIPTTVVAAIRETECRLCKSYRPSFKKPGRGKCMRSKGIRTFFDHCNLPQEEE